MSNLILCWPQQHNTNPSFGFRVTYNDQVRKLPQYMRSWLEDRNLLERISDFNQRSPEEFVNHGSSKILNTSTPSREQPNMVFPDAKPNREMPNIPILGNKSPCGDGKPFCEKVDTYPAELIGNILKNSAENIADYFPKDELPIEIGERFNPNEENLCYSKTEIIRPQSAENKDGQWLFIVNHDNYLQEVRTEVCEGNEKKCQFAEFFPIGYKAFCKQHYVFRKLYALEQGTGKVIKDNFKLPSCCTCVVRYVNTIE